MVDPDPRTIVLDTAPLLAGLGPAQAGPAAAGTRWICPPSVVAEVRPGGPTGRALERAEAAGLVVRAPTAEALQRVDEGLAQYGESKRLSAADRDVLALALDVSAAGPAVIWTDDYAVQNVAKVLGIRTENVLTQGIQTTATWYIRCTGCARYPETSAAGDTCPVCGSPLKRTRVAPRRTRP